MANALGIISYNDYTVHVQGMQKFRPIAAFSFVGRYRMVDFPLSNMTNSGINHIQVYINGNPRSLIEHIGRGRQYNINSKHGSLSLIPIFDAEGSMTTPDVESYYGNLHSIKSAPCDYVIIAPANIINKANYSDLLDQHIESGADISVLYQNVDDAKERYIGCDVLQLNRQKGVLSIERNLGNYKNRALSLQTYIMSKEIFAEAVTRARETSSMYWFKDIVNDLCEEKDIRAINYRGKFFYVNDLKSYFESNLAFLDVANMKEFIDPDWAIYTQSKDTAPAIYLNNGHANCSLISNGCKISGEVKNSVVGRSCVIGKNAVIENCVICPEVTIADNAHLKNVIVDKYCRIIHKKDLEGTPDEPLYIARRENV